MSTDTVTLFFALLAVAAQVGVAAVVVLTVGGRWSVGLARARARLVDEIAPQALALATVVAAICTGGSLYLSEVAHFSPCRLCWYQRFAMYPQVLLLGISALLGSTRLRLVSAALAVIGAGVSCYHLLVERYPNLESSACDLTNPCSIVWVKHFGYLTIPGMALSGFLLILTLLAVARPRAAASPTLELL